MEAIARLPRPSTEAYGSNQRRRIYWALVDWLYRRWDFTDDEFALAVYGVCAGSAMVWETWLDMAPLDKLAHGLELIEAEDAYLGDASPWRKPKYR